MAWYVARIANQDGAFAVSFPDAPSICVRRASLEDAVERASHSLAWHLDSLRAKGIAPPAPTPMAQLERASPAGSRTEGAPASFALIEIADDLQAPAPRVQAPAVETPPAVAAVPLAIVAR